MDDAFSVFPFSRFPFLFPSPPPSPLSLMCVKLTIMIIFTPLLTHSRCSADAINICPFDARAGRAVFMCGGVDGAITHNARGAWPGRGGRVSYLRGDTRNILAGQRQGRAGAEPPGRALVGPRQRQLRQTRVGQDGKV